jgi:uncharacterized protein involved in exopolysaccharide biosynthesis
MSFPADFGNAAAPERAPQAAVASDAPLSPNWVVNATLLWDRRQLLFRVSWISLLLGLIIAFTISKRYKSSASIMPPSNSSASSAMIAALAGRALGGLNGLGSLAGSLLGGNNTTELFVDMLHSGTVAGTLIDRFDLQHVYHKRYRVDTVKHLAHITTITEDKKSGAITITVEDTDPRRARDLAQGYLDALNLLINHTSTSSAHQERVFIEKRLRTVHANLEQAQQDLSAFSSTHTTVDIKEQTHAMVDAASRLQAQMILEQSSLDSLRQVYGDQNIRVRSEQARIGVLQTELAKMSGSSAPLSAKQTVADAGEGPELYPPLRQLPRLAVPYADLYRKVQVQETVFELLTQQDELARIQEAKDVPVISVIDAPGIPEKKSFPPRLLLALSIALACTAIAAALLLLHRQWSRINPTDPRKQLIQQIGATLRARLHRQTVQVGEAS